MMYKGVKASIVFLILFVSCVSILEAQYVNESQIEERLEFPVSSVVNENLIVPLEDKNLLVFRQTDENLRGVTGKQDVWMVSKYNSRLKEVWSEPITVVKKGRIHDYILDEEKGTIYVLAAQAKGGNMSSSPNWVKGDFQIHSINIDNGTSDIVYGKLPSTIISSFTKSRDVFYVSGFKMPGTLRLLCNAYLMYTIFIFNPIKALNTNPYSISVNMKTGRIKELDQKFKGLNLLLAASGSKNNGTNEVIYKNILSKKRVNIIKFEIDGDRVNDVREIEVNPDKQFNSAKIYVHKGEKFMLGCYGDRSKMNTNFLTTMGHSSTGVYFANVSDYNSPDIKYYDFTELESLQQLYEDAYESRSGLGKMLSRKKTGEGAINQYVLLHDVQVIDNEIMVMGEAYYPVYNTYTTFNADGSTTTHQQFLGYQFLNFFMVAFDEKGIPQWDVAFNTGDLRTFKLKETVRVIKERTGYTFMYSDGYQIVSKKMKGREIVEDRADLVEPDEEVKKSYEQSMEYWYDNYYIAYGTQKIKDKSKSGFLGSGKRKVFFMSKMKK